jgi:hypothetical protein
MTNETRAAVLAGTITASTIEPTAMHLRQGPALRITVDNPLQPLDLDSEVFRYLVPRRCSHRHRR